MNAPGEELPLFSDLSLSRRLERAEGRGCVDFVETRARLVPDSGACWIEVAGAYALYDGPASPLTQTFGLGLYQPATAADLEMIEAFFGQRGAPVFHEVSPLADPPLLTLLNERGYQPMEFTSVLFRPLRDEVRLAGAGNARVRVRLIEAAEQELWARTAAEGWSDAFESPAQLPELGRVSAARAGARAFLAELDGRAVAAGLASICDGVLLMGGASTVPAARKLGAQLALLEGRLRYGASAGCDVAMICALPGSASQRNAERHGFRVAYTRIKWRLARRTNP
jgi:hypothetical protein